jgi:hypothetical protein
LNEIELLRNEVTDLQEMRRRLREQYHDDRIATRKMPPLSQLTRVQKRFMLEAWYTVIWITSWVLAAASAVLAIWTPWHAKFWGTMVIFLVIGIAAAVCKLQHLDLNVRAEGQLLDRGPR